MMYKTCSPTNKFERNAVLNPIALVNEILNANISAQKNNVALQSKPTVNIKENATEYSLEVAIPGWTKEEIEISIEKNILTVAGKNPSKSEQTEKFLRKEFVKNDFERSFKVSEKVAIEGIKASFNNGLLYLSLPKKQEEKAEKQIITVV